MSKHSEETARATLAEIRRMVQALHDAETDEEREAAEQAIQEDPLEIAVRGDWYNPCETQEPDNKPTEYKILLCTGGPAIRIIGELDEWGQPETDSTWIEHQDWFEGWTSLPIDQTDHNVLTEYAAQFYYGQ